MTRGDVVTVALTGDYGKPRPAVIVQSALLSGLSSVLVAPVTSHEGETPDYRLTLTPTSANGLNRQSQVMVDKIVAVPVAKCGAVIGRINDKDLVELNGRIALTFGLADRPARPRRWIPLKKFIAHGGGTKV